MDQAYFSSVIAQDLSGRLLDDERPGVSCRAIKQIDTGVQTCLSDFGNNECRQTNQRAFIERRTQSYDDVPSNCTAEKSALARTGLTLGILEFCSKSSLSRQKSITT